MLDKDVQAKIDQLYADMKPLMDHFKMKPRTIEERYEDIKRRQSILDNVPKPRFKLPKL